MRRSGVVRSARGLAPPDGHVCWAYGSRAEFLARAAEYAHDGLAAGEYVEYVGEGSAESLRAELAGLDGLGAALQRGDLGVCPAAEFYGTGRDLLVDADAAVARRVAAVERAIAAGYCGFRAVVDATAVARTREQREAFARFEQLIDRQMSVLPVGAICAYDARELGAAVAELACLHPLANDAATKFWLYAEPGVDFAVSGEVDRWCGDVFGETLRRLAPRFTSEELVVDGHALRFIDYQGLVALDRSAREHDRRVVLRTRSASLARLAGLLRLPAVTVAVVR